MCFNKFSSFLFVSVIYLVFKFVINIKFSFNNENNFKKLNESISMTCFILINDLNKKNGPRIKIEIFLRR